MRSGYQMRKWAAAERRDDEPCPRCDHRMGEHRGMPGECDCGCVVSFADLNRWRAEGRVSR